MMHAPSLLIGFMCGVSVATMAIVALILVLPKGRDMREYDETGRK